MNHDYFDHHYVSNSDLKRLRKIIDPKFEDPADIEEIFKFGRLVEDLIFQPHQADYGHKDLGLAMDMAETFRKDPICSQILYVHDLRRQHEWYRSDVLGVPGRCKTDADSKALNLIFELKGLSIGSDAAFESAIDRFDYDQGLFWYQRTTLQPRHLLVAVSKKAPKKIFKRLTDIHHLYYDRGQAKAVKHLRMWKEMFPQPYYTL